MNPPKHSEEMPFPPGTMNLDTSKQARDYSPQTNLHIPRPHDGKHAGAIRPYRPKKGASNTPSPLGRKDQFQDSRSRLDSKSLSRCDRNSRKQFDSCRPSKKKASRQLEQIYSELLDLKAEYKSLKLSYNNLLREKQQYADQIRNTTEQMIHLTQENSRLKKDLERMKNQLQFSEHQLQRIKKECFKLLEIENFKNKKLEETLQEKELMIHYLRNQFGKENCDATANLSRNIFLQTTTTPIFRSNQFDPKGLDALANKANASVLSLQSIFAAGPTENQKSKVMLSSMSEIERNRNASNISDDSLSFSKDNNPKSNSQLQSIIFSPMKVSKRNCKENDSNLPGCCTFQLKENDTEKSISVRQKQKALKKRLIIATDGSHKTENNQEQKNIYCDEQSIDTKKRNEDSYRRRHRNKDEEKDISNHSAERRMRKIDVQLPTTKSRKSRVQNNISCR